MSMWLKGLLRGRRQTPLDDVRRAIQIALEVSGWLRDTLPIGPEIIEEMSYSEAISYFVEQRPPSTRVAKGAMILQSRPQGCLLIQVFLDRSNELVCAQDGKPFGRRLIVHRLDAELSQTFDGKDLLIVT